MLTCFFFAWFVPIRLILLCSVLSYYFLSILWMAYPRASEGASALIRFSVLRAKMALDLEVTYCLS